MDVSKFLIYGLLDPRTNEVRYIGKSATGMKRPNLHRKPSCLAKDRTHKAHWIRALQKAGMTYKVEVLEYVGTRVELNTAERYWIGEAKAHGWRLTNLTEGGDGLSGAVFSKEHRARISIANKGRKLTDEQRRKLSVSAKSRAYDPVKIEAMRQSHIGTHRSVAFKAMVSRVHRGKVLSAATKAKIAAANSRSVRELASGTVYKSAADAARLLGIEYTGVVKVASGRTRLKSIHGYRFEYVSP
jgi:hypothetical protein